MSKTILLAVGLALLASPALSQSSPRSDDRDSYADRRDRDRGWGRERDGWHDMSDDERGEGNCRRYRETCQRPSRRDVCQELRSACLQKERLGERGEGNCRRYRETCR